MIEVAVYIVTLVAIVIGIGFVVYTMNGKEKELESTVSGLDAKNQESQDAIRRVHHKFDHDMKKAQDAVNNMNTSVNGLHKKVEAAVSDYETKFNAIQQDIRATRTKLETRIRETEKALNDTSTSLKTSIQKNTDELMALQSKATTLDKQISDNQAQFKEFKETVGSKLGSLSSLKQRLQSLEGDVKTMKSDVQKMQSSVNTIVSRLSEISKLSDKINAIDERTAGVSKESYDMMLKTIQEYKDVMPRLKTLPQDYVTKTSLQSLEDQYKKDMPELQAQLTLLKTRVSTGTDADSQINAAMTELQSLVAKLKSDISQTSELLDSVGKVRKLNEQVGDVNIAQYKEQLALLPKLGSLISQVGTANIAQYKDQLPLLSKVTDLVKQVGDVNLAQYKDQIALLSQVPDLNAKITNLQSNIKTVEQEIPNLSKTLSAIQTIVKDLEQKTGGSGELQAVQKVLNEYKAVLSTSNNNVTAKNAICIEDICITKDQLRALVGSAPRPTPPIIPDGTTQSPYIHFEASSAIVTKGKYITWNESRAGKVNITGNLSAENGYPVVRVDAVKAISMELSSNSGFVITAVVNLTGISNGRSLVSLFNYTTQTTNGRKGKNITTTVLSNEISLTSAFSKPYDNFGAIVRSSSTHRVTNQFPHRLQNRWNIITMMVTPEGRSGSTIRLFVNGAHTFNITNVFDVQNIYHQNATYTQVPYGPQYNQLRIGNALYRDILIHNRPLNSNEISSVHHFFLRKYKDITPFGSPFIPPALLGSTPGVFLYDSTGIRYPFIGPRYYSGNELSNVNWNNRAIGIWVKIGTQVACWSGNNRSGTKAMYAGIDYPGNYYVLPSNLQQRISSLEIVNFNEFFYRYR